MRALPFVLVASMLLGGCSGTEERTPDRHPGAAAVDTGTAGGAEHGRSPRAARTGESRPPDTMYVYMSPRGDDGNPGSRERPVASLARVHEILAQRAPDADVVVKVRSDAGPYINQTVLWTYYHPRRSITIESDSPERNASFVAGDDPPGRPFFALSAMRGEATNVVLRRLTVRNYATRAVLFFGDREIRGHWNGYNSIERCRFENIGNAGCPARAIVYSAVCMINSRNNRIVGCTFLDIKNHTLANYPQAGEVLAPATRPKIKEDYDKLKSVGPGSNPNIPIIAVYFAHHSDSNIVDSCIFRRVKGDVIRMRDDSNGNRIVNNHFELAGWNAIVSMWYCDVLKQPCIKEFEPERVSTGNIVRRNRAVGNWRGGVPRLFCDLRAQECAGKAATDVDPRLVLLEDNTAVPYR